MALKPTHRQKVCAVLWAQGYTAHEVGRRLGITDRGVYNRMYRMKATFPDVWQRMNEIRKCYRKQRDNCRRPLRVEDMDHFSLGDTTEVTLLDGTTEQLKVLMKF